MRSNNDRLPCNGSKIRKTFLEDHNPNLICEMNYAVTVILTKNYYFNENFRSMLKMIALFMTNTFYSQMTFRMRTFTMFSLRFLLFTKKFIIYKYFRSSQMVMYMISKTYLLLSFVKWLDYDTV